MWGVGDITPNSRPLRYKGEVTPDGNAASERTVIVIYNDGDVRLLAHRQSASQVCHSPGGFSWGYTGSGPATLARCILWEQTGQEPSPETYQAFKREIVVQWPQDGGWTLDATHVENWLRLRNRSARLAEHCLG